MRFGNAIVVVMSLTAFAASARFAVSTPTVAPAASPADDADSPRPSVPPAPILLAGRAQAVSGGTPRTGPVDHRTTEPRAPSATGATLYSSTRPTGSTLDDSVLVRIERALSKLRGFTDDQAVEYVNLTDDEYRACQEQANRPPEFQITTTPRVFLPNREPDDVEAWARQPIELPDLDVKSRESYVRLISTSRRRAVREYRFEVARLRLASLREYAGHRDERRRASTRDDAAAFGRAFGLWIQRQLAWVEAEADSAQDESELDSLVRSIPRRHWTLDRSEDLQEVFDNAMLDSFPDAHVPFE